MLGQQVPEAPDPEFLARGIISSLDIARQAHFAQKDWTAALRRIDAILEVKRELQRPAEDMAIQRLNRATVLKRLERFDEARAELEACLQAFQNDPYNKSKAISSLADLFADQGDLDQAITQQRRALALQEQLSDPRDRAFSHENLGISLAGRGTPADLAEAPHHLLAALIYRLVSELWQDLQTLSLHNYAIAFRHARAANTPLNVPLVAELLADPAFQPLADWLKQKQVDEAEIQAAVDELLEQARQKALAEE